MKKGVFRVLSALLAVLFIVSSAPVSTAEEGDDGVFRYTELPDGTVEITGFSDSPVPDLVIPSEINGKTVSSIGDSSFCFKQEILHLTISEGVKYIKDHAFESCESLIDAVISDTVESIGKRAFIGCHSLTKVTIGKSVKLIDTDAFSWSGKIESVSIPDSVETVGECAFLNCGAIKDVHIGDGVKTIGDKAFNLCGSIENLYIGKSVKSIGKEAFAWCGKIESVSIPDSVETIGDNAFECCGAAKELYIGNNVKSIGKNAFAWCGKIESVSIPDSVETIGDFAFYNCFALMDVKMGENVKSIGNSAFLWCGFKRFYVPESVTEIGDYALGYTGDEHNPVLGFSVYGVPGTAAEVYAVANNFRFIDKSAFNPDSNDLFANNLIKKRTREEIETYIKSHPTHISDKVYDIEPVVEPGNYSPGKLSAEHLESALNNLNIYRFIVGLDEVTLDEGYNELCQAGALVNAANDVMTHGPLKPAGMSDELYEKGKTGCGSSNLAAGCLYLSDSVNLWMDDTNHSGDLGDMGHRRWCINPPMQKTGFGLVGAYSAVYAFDSCFATHDDEFKVAWPASITPSNRFHTGTAWSLSKDGAFSENAAVELTRLSDNRVWKFDKNSGDKRFFISNEGFGQYGCVIWRPDDVGESFGNDSFHVKINDGDFSLEYDVNFYCDHAEETIPGKPATCVESGLTDGTKCSLCGAIIKEQEEIPALGHTPETIPGKPATCVEKGLTEGTKCSVCGKTIVPQKLIPLTDHTPGDWETVVPAEVGIPGLEQRKCTVCGEVLEEREIPALSEHPTDSATSPSTEPADKPTQPAQPTESTQPTTRPSSEPGSKYALGDVNGDEKITASDARIALRISAKLHTPTETETLASDTDKNGSITASDARIILRFSAKLQSSF